MLRRLLILLILFLPAGAGAASVGDASVATYRLLSAELHLARQKQIYFLFDLPAGRIEFRATGLTVAELPLAGWRRWGRDGEPQATVLLEKDSLSQPQRTKIKVAPGSETPTVTAGGHLEALELDDMPERYQLVLDDGTVIRVAPVAQGILGRIVDGWRWFGWYLSRPLISDWKFIRGKPYTELVVVLQPRDAKLLYWSFTAGERSLIRWPPR